MLRIISGNNVTGTNERTYTRTYVRVNEQSTLCPNVARRRKFFTLGPGRDRASYDVRPCMQGVPVSRAFSVLRSIMSVSGNRKISLAPESEGKFLSRITYRTRRLPLDACAIARSFTPSLSFHPFGRVFNRFDPRAKDHSSRAALKSTGGESTRKSRDRIRESGMMSRARAVSPARVNDASVSQAAKYLPFEVHRAVFKQTSPPLRESDCPRDK